MEMEEKKGEGVMGAAHSIIFMYKGIRRRRHRDTHTWVEGVPPLRC